MASARRAAAVPLAVVGDLEIAVDQCGGGVVDMDHPRWGGIGGAHHVVDDLADRQPAADRGAASGNRLASAPKPGVSARETPFACGKRM